ncbi:BLOC-1-related complex subunit 6 [Echinops telfairi]|uniref:BLOC-1-related complex subunit 6 n=1 Tax=Echinops telfairi TaxID=9371 RepID=A0AC55DBX9_ECHTE|nr:BLOC-1-related complex subunit 6 [Echinops telfairi]
MESSRGRPGPETNPAALGKHQAAIFGGGPGRTPSEPSSDTRRSEKEEAENVRGASRHLRASPKTTSCSAAHGSEREVREDEPGPRGTPSGTRSRRGPPGLEHDPPPSAGRPDPDPPEGEPASETASCGGRRATISSALELEGTVSRHGDLTHFVANNLQLKIRLSGAAQPPPPAPSRPCPTSAPTPAIPPIDPDVLRDLERLSRELGGRVDRLLRGLGGAVQELTALSVGCIQTYRDAVDSLGEAVDMSIKGMYTLLARCEELERALQPVQGLARQVRDIRRTLEVLEALCK